MKKIIVEKSEGIAEIIDKILATSEEEIVLVIPRGSTLAKSASNFRLLKREAGLADKKVMIDSADETITDLAEKHGITLASAAGAMKHHTNIDVSDIVAKSSKDKDEDEDDDESEEPVRPAKPSVKLAVRTEEEEQESSLARDRFFKPRSIASISPKAGRGRDEDDEDDDEEGSGRGISGKTIGWIAGVIVALAVIFYSATILFGRAQVTIDFTQTPWSYQSNIIAEQSVSTSTTNGNTTIIPAQVFTTQKNITQLFPATGQSQNVVSKAQGTITIVNDYGAAPQELVATTRFETPSGQIFRLVNDTTVPGATVAANGTITPSSIDAPIIADQGGAAYDVGPIAKLTIPGFQNDPGKEAGFYGEIKGQTTGGATGIKPIPTAADIAAAKASTTAILQADLQSGLAASYPNNFKILDGATDVQITKLTVNTSTDANGNFSVFGEASLTAIGFDESALTNYLLGLAQSQAPAGSPTMAFTPQPPVLSYGSVQATFSKGEVSFTLSGQGTLEPAFSTDQFASQVAGESIGAARDAIQNLPQLSDGKISVWPIWLWSMPSNPDKISVTAS